MYLKRKTQKGFTLVETLVAILVLTIGITAPLTIASKGLQSSTYSLEQNTAFFLAQEAIEILKAQRNSSGLAHLDPLVGASSIKWFNDIFSGPACLNEAPCYFGLDTVGNYVNCNIDPEKCRLFLDTTSSLEVYTHSPGPVYSNYLRTIRITKGSNNEIELQSKVEWTSQLFSGAKKNVTLTTHLFDIYK